MAKEDLKVVDKTEEPRKLSLAESMALTVVRERIERAQAELAAAQQQMNALMSDMGLDPKGAYRVTPEGSLIPA